MPSLKDIRTRIASVKNTKQITRAMKMVSAAKLRRAQENIINLRPYAQKLLSVIADVASTQRVAHPLLDQKRQRKKLLAVVITSDRGLCGGFNGSALKAAERFYTENKNSYEQLDFLLIGRKAIDYFKRRNINPVNTMTNLAKDISYNLAEQVAEKLMAQFVTGEYDEIKLIYNEFKSAISQIVTTETIFPVDISQAPLEKQAETNYSRDLIFEPSPEEIIEQLLKKHFAIQVYRTMSESVAAEHAARMTAMENATSNASEMIDGLTLTYNKLRQASITKELIEITTGADALN